MVTEGAVQCRHETTSFSLSGFPSMWYHRNSFCKPAPTDGKTVNSCRMKRSFTVLKKKCPQSVICLLMIFPELITRGVSRQTGPLSVFLFLVFFSPFLFPFVLLFHPFAACLSWFLFSVFVSGFFLLFSCSCCLTFFAAYPP